MRTKWAVAAAAIGACGPALAPAGFAAAEDSAQEVISRLQSDGYTVNIDRIGTAPISECEVTSVRNPQTVTQLTPYIGPFGGGAGTIVIPQVTSQTISVSLDCSR